MPEPKDILNKLRTFAGQIRNLNVRAGAWTHAEKWLAKVRPFLRKNFPDYVSDFEKLTSEPTWVDEQDSDSGLRIRNQQSNSMLATGKNKALAAFLESLVGIVEGEMKDSQRSAKQEPKPRPRPENPSVLLPFRPYKRYRAEILKIGETWERVQMAAMESSANHIEVEGLGGYAAILASIRRHLPDFDVAKAQSPNDPEWVRLKPILARAGMPTDDNITLSDIKGFLDATEPTDTKQPRGEMAVTDKRNVWVVHGRNEPARKAMFTFLRSLDLKPIEWEEAVNQTQAATPHISDILDAAFSKAQAVVVILTGDDEARLREQFWDANESSTEKDLSPQARPNVLFEAGMAFGRHPDRTILVEFGTVRQFSNVAGRNVVRMSDSFKSRDNLRQRLITSECAVNQLGTDWHTSGDFDAALKLATQTMGNRVLERQSRSMTNDTTRIDVKLDGWDLFKNRGTLATDTLVMVDGWGRGDVRFEGNVRLRNNTDHEQQIHRMRVEFRRSGEIIWVDNDVFSDQEIALPPKVWQKIRLDSGVRKGELIEHAESLWFVAETIGDGHLVEAEIQQFGDLETAAIREGG